MTARLRRLARRPLLNIYARWQDFLVWFCPTAGRHARHPLLGPPVRLFAHIYAEWLRHRGVVIPYEELEALIQQPDGLQYAAATCACRRVWKHCDVSAMPPTCLYVGDAAGIFARVDAREARLITKEQALEVARWCREHHLVHSVWTHTAEQIYAICNCCPQDCAGMQLARQGIAAAVAPSAWTSVTDLERCTACGACVDFCATYPFAARRLEPDHGTPTVAVDPARCVGCGVCRDLCPAGAIALVRR